MERKAISSDRSISSHKPEDKNYFFLIKIHPKLFLMVRPIQFIIIKKPMKPL
ncbi:hypothetical protein PSGL111025_01965 [Psychrobacter glaciei]